MTNPPDRHVRSTIPTAWACRLGHIAADTGLTRQELVRQGGLLILRHHGQGDGLPEPIMLSAIASGLRVKL